MVMALLGVLLLDRIGESRVIPVVNISIFGLVLFVHVVNAFAIITQAAAAAIAYDMREDKEFERETAPWGGAREATSEAVRPDREAVDERISPG